MPVVRNVTELQNVLKGWMRRPNETDEEYQNRVNDPSNEISFDLFGLRDMVTEQIENGRAEKAKPVSSDGKSFFEQCDDIDVILTEANKKENEPDA